MHTPLIPFVASTSYAATEAPAVFGEIAGLIAAGALVAYICHRFRIMPIVSFLITGAIVGPHALGLVTDQELINTTAEIGVVLLLFTIGIEFSLDKLARIKRIIFIGGGLQVGLVIAVVAGALAFFGVPWRTAIFTGCLVALSSTAIVMKLVMGSGEMGSREGQGALGILIFQDLAVVAMVMVVPMLGGAGGSAADIGLALGKAVVIIALVLVVARRVMPRILEAVARTCSQEIFLLTVVGICFGTAYLTSLVGVSLSLGAFLAGLLVSESRFSHLAFGEILPLQILFSATFFVSVGLLLDLGYMIENPAIILGVIGLVLVVKVVTTAVSLKVIGYSLGSAATAALMLAQVGEFSFVLERTGRSVGLAPGGLTEGGPEAFIAATVALMMATPLLHRLGHRLSRRRGKTEGAPSAESTPESGQEELAGHVIIGGYGRIAHQLAPILAEQNVPYIVVTLSPDGALEAEQKGLRVLRGNYSRQHELTLAGLRRARLLVVADDDAETTQRAVASARALDPDLPIVARALEGHEAAGIRDAGASTVIVDEVTAAAEILGRVLEAVEMSHEQIRWHQVALTHPRESPRAAGGENTLLETAGAVELSDEQRASPRCEHTATAARVTPSAPGCEECLRISGSWVHLRICMTCGFVGCCESSPHRHAMKHHQGTSHSVIRSLEPGEDWAWCYAEQTFL